MLMTHLQLFDTKNWRQISSSSTQRLGDRSPSELLTQLKITLGKDDYLNETATFLLLCEFLDRMPPHIRQIQGGAERMNVLKMVITQQK